MSSIKRISFIILSFLCCHSVFSQDDKKIVEIFKKTSSVYKNETNISIGLTYKLFVDYTGSKTSEKYNGIFVQKNGSTYQKIHNTEFIQTSAIGVKVNHDQKMMLVVKNVAKNAGTNPIEISGYLKHFKYKTVKDLGSLWKCILQTSSFTQLPYGKIEIFINKNSYKIDKQVLYFLEKVPYKDAKGKEKSDYPRLEIVIKDLKVEEPFIQNAFNIKNYIQVNGNDYLPSKKYSNYKLYKG